MVHELNPCLQAVIESSPDRVVVRLRGEMDLAGREQLLAVCSTQKSHGLPVEIDLAETTFMDCSGYRSLQRARMVLQKHGGFRGVRNAVGQPARLLELISELDQTRLATAI